MSYSAFAKYLANAFLYKKKKKEKTFSWIPSPTVTVTCGEDKNTRF